MSIRGRAIAARLVAAAVVGVGCTLIAAGNAAAIVGRFDDPATGGTECNDFPSEDCSLRHEIEYRNTHGGGSIQLLAGTYTLEEANGPLTPGMPLTITGMGARATRISGQNATGVFDVSGDLTLSNLAVVDGNNKVGDGGGIRVNNRHLTLNSVAVTGNTAFRHGGGIYGFDGAVLTIDKSTIAGNHAGNSGGGIAVRQANGTAGSSATVTNSTFANNSAVVKGGAIYSGIGDATFGTSVSLANVTVARNSSPVGDPNQGGAVALEPTTGNMGGAVSMVNTIVASQTAGSDCLFAVTDGGHNRASDQTCFASTPAAGSLSNAIPVLGPLADNGGATDTLALGTTSDAIDQGASCVVAPDQRGVARASATDGTGATCDIGAYEAIKTADLAVAQTAPASVNVGDNVSYTITVSSSLAPTPNTKPDAAYPTLVDSLPGGTTFVSATPSQGTCSGTSTVTCALGKLANGSSAMVTLVVTAPTAGTLSNTPTVSSPRFDANGTNDSATATTTVTGPSEEPPPGGGSPPPGDTGTTPPPGGATPPGTTPPPDTTSPVLGPLALSRSAFKAAKGTSLTFTLSETSTVTLTVQRTRAGRKVGKRCVRPTRKNRRKRKCTRLTSLGSLTLAGVAGANEFHFRGRVKGKALKPGTYRLTAVAVDAAGNESRREAKSFRIKR